MSTRIGVDIGGTFTDLVFYEEQSGAVVVAKVPTTPQRPESGCISAVRASVPNEILRRATYFLHGTTVGLNALLERKGAKLGMIVTAGFRDVLEIRDGTRGEPYNIYWVPPKPLVSRELRQPVRERTAFDGSVVTPLSESDVLAAYGTLRDANVASIAIAFLHSYANPAHELAAERTLRAAGFSGPLSLSHRVSGEYRDYERFSTTVIDAFVRARMSGYLQKIEDELRAEGFEGVCLVTRSGTGSMTFAEAHDRPAETINSGPVAGVEGASQLARRLRIPNLITADVGGTSFDTALIIGGRPRIVHVGMVAGMPLQTPWVDVRSIGAGGGSIARVDVGGLLSVGPQSAGAEPGPICYGRGGTEVTVTDAALFLGMLGDQPLASGLVLDRDAIEGPLAQLARRLNYTSEKLATGIISIVGNHMANLIRELTIEQGLDPRNFTLLPFGGAGPLMATQIARELDVREVLIPRHAGNFSAWGLLGADLLRDRARTKVMLLTDAAIAACNEILGEMVPLLVADFSKFGGSSGHLIDSVDISLDLRYDGQEHTLPISPSHTGGCISAPATEIAEVFHRAYRDRYGGSLEERIQIVTTRATLRSSLPGWTDKFRYETGGCNSAQAFSFASNTRMTFKTLHRGDLVCGEVGVGPAIIYEPTTTTYVDSDFAFSVTGDDCLCLRRT